MVEASMSMLKFAGVYDSNNKYNPGDLFVYHDRIHTMLENGDICELGGIPSLQTVRVPDQCCTDRRPMPSKTNCCNCGAPLGYHFRCEYCGTLNQ